MKKEDGYLIGCGGLTFIVLLCSLATSYPKVAVTVGILFSAICYCVAHYLGKKVEEDKKKELRPSLLHEHYPLFFQAIYYQNISKKPFKPEFVSEHQSEWRACYNDFSDEQASRWNDAIKLLIDLNNKDHDLLIQYISQGTSTSAKKYHRRSINPVFLLPYSFIERVSQEAIDQLIADKERDEKYNDLCKRYRKFLGQFLKLHPELKEKSQILEAEEALKAFIEENKKQWAYDDWKESQQEFTHTVSMKASTVFPNSHVLVRNAPLKNIGNGMETTDDQVTVCQVALCEYSDPVSEDQSAEDRQRNAWVKGLSFCNAKYDHAVTKQLFDFIKQDNANDNEILIVEVKDNFLGWDSKTISFHYASFDTALDRIDHCGVDELEETLAGRKKYKYVVVFDLISDEQQVDNVCKSILSCYTDEMPLFLYVSLVRKLTEDETKERTAIERIRRERVKRYNDIIDECPNGLTLWKATYQSDPNMDAIVDREEKIRESELSVSLDDIRSYATYYLTLGMNIGSTTKRNAEDDTDDSITTIAIKEAGDINLVSGKTDSMISLLTGGATSYRSITIHGLSDAIVNELNNVNNEPFSFTPAFDNLLKECLHRLGLPDNYPWVVIDAGHNRCSIIVQAGTANDTLIHAKEGFANLAAIKERQIMFSSDADKAPFDSLTISWNEKLPLPPSNGCWFWYYSLPEGKPLRVSITDIDSLIYAHCSTIKYQSHSHNGRTFYIALRQKIKGMGADDQEWPHPFASDKDWLDQSTNTNALTEKGVYYALGINGFKENKIKAKYCLFKADSQIAKYNLASMMACGFLDMGQYSIPMLLAEAKGMKHVEIIKKNYVETNYFSEE